MALDIESGLPVPSTSSGAHHHHGHDGTLASASSSAAATASFLGPFSGAAGSGGGGGANPSGGAAAPGGDGDDDDDGGKLVGLGRLPEQYRPLLTWPPMRAAHPHARTAAVWLDRACVLAGQVVVQRPGVRLGAAAYLLLLHLFMLVIVSSRHVPCAAHSRTL